MTAPSITPLQALPDLEGLDRHALLAAADRLCGANRASALLLRQLLKRLVARTDNWPAQARRLDRVGFSARHLAAPLRHVLDLPGDLAIVQLRGATFLLLHRNQQRWQVIGADGEVLADMPDPAGEAFVEAVVLRTPLARLRIDGLASLAALWPALRAAWAEVGLASLFVNAGQLLLPLFSMLVYDKVVSNGVFETLWALAIGMMLYLAADGGMRVVRAWSTERIGDELTRRSDENLWHRLSAQVETPTGGVARFLSNYRDLALSREFVSSTYLLALADTPFLVLYLIVIGIIAWPLLIVAALLVSLYAALGLLLQARATRLGKEAEQHNTRKLAFMGEILGALDVARTVPGAGTFLRRWRELSDQSAGIDGRRRLSTHHLNTLSAAMQTFSTVVMLAAGAYLIEARLLSVGGLIASNLLASRAMGLVASLFMVAGKWQDFQRAAARMESSLETSVEKEYVPRPSTAGHIVVLGLGKRYAGRPAALDSVSFSVAPGERIALLGKPGAGKTTLLRSLAGLCRPDAGQILVDGLALDDIARLDRTRWLAWKSQDSAVFAGSLEDNLRIAGGGCDGQRRARAIWASGLEEELNSGRMTLGMHLDERGGNLSGGQRQKVALARAFAQPSRILLLDEPTLGLDPDSERLLAERLPKVLTDDAVLIMTTHSVIMLGMVERVIAMDGGRLVADGPRETLVRVA
ncbi:MAG: ATP-binding cassette domain-containing protein [Rhodocyclales bacterium]|nr:ATP-binding cassette domain-containing protein [Rhodocyclales bacterium]